MFNMTPEMRDFLLHMGGGLLMGGRNNAEAVGRSLLMGAQGRNEGKVLRGREKTNDLSRQQQQMQMDQSRRTMEQSEKTQGLLSGLMQQNPQLAPLLQLAPEKALDRLYPKQNMQFAPNGVPVDMNALQPNQGNYAKQAEWKDPAYQQFMMDKAKAGAPRVNVDTRQETEFAKALGKDQGESYSNLMKSDAMASSQLNKLGRLESLLASSGNTGKLTPATMELKAAADSLGFKVDSKLPFQQAAQALSNEIALSLRNPAGGAGMPGALSDRDREFLTNMVPNLAKTPEGNKELIGTMKKLAQREKDVAKLARDYRKRTGKFDEGFYDELAQFSAANPLFGSGDLTPAEQAELADLRKRFKGGR